MGFSKESEGCWIRKSEMAPPACIRHSHLLSGDIRVLVAPRAGTRSPRSTFDILSSSHRVPFRGCRWNALTSEVVETTSKDPSALIDADVMFASPFMRTRANIFRFLATSWSPLDWSARPPNECGSRQIDTSRSHQLMIKRPLYALLRGASWGNEDRVRCSSMPAFWRGITTGVASGPRYKSVSFPVVLESSFTHLPRPRHSSHGLRMKPSSSHRDGGTSCGIFWPIWIRTLWSSCRQPYGDPCPQ